MKEKFYWEVESIQKVRKISYQLLMANIHMWYILIKQKQDDERAKKIYFKREDMLMSSLSIFFVVVIVSLIASGVFNNQAIPFLILVFGGNSIATVLLLNREESFYWKWKIKKDEEELKIREAAKQKRREQEELERKRANAERMRQFFEQQQRAQQQFQSAQINNEFTYHLSNLGLTSDCRDMSLIKKAYRSLMKKHHPDIDKGANSTENTKTIVASYKFLEKKLSSL